MNFQPSELAKLAIAMYAASYMVRKMDVKENFVRAVWPMAVALGFIGVLLLREPDMGAFMVIAHRSRWASCSSAASTGACSCSAARCWSAPSC